MALRARPGLTQAPAGSWVGMSQDDVWRDPERLPLDDLADAMAVYSTDGQLDDVTGNEAGTEEAFGNDARVDVPEPEELRRPSPEGRSGPH